MHRTFACWLFRVGPFVLDLAIRPEAEAPVGGLRPALWTDCSNPDPVSSSGVELAWFKDEDPVVFALYVVAFEFPIWALGNLQFVSLERLRLVNLRMGRKDRNFCQSDEP